MECGHQVLQLLLEDKGVSRAGGVWVGTLHSVHSCKYTFNDLLCTPLLKAFGPKWVVK